MEDCWHWSKEVITGTKSRGRKVSVWKCEWGHLFWLANVALCTRWEPQPRVTSRVRGGEEGTGLHVTVSHRQGELAKFGFVRVCTLWPEYGFSSASGIPTFCYSCVCAYRWHAPSQTALLPRCQTQTHQEKFPGLTGYQVTSPRGHAAAPWRKTWKEKGSLETVRG